MESNNPLMARLKLPGRTFQLPSKGLFYNNGELASEEGEIHVHALSALTEINLKNPDLLFNGKALEQVCAECIPEIKKSAELYGKDIDALMLYLRVVTYGPLFEVQVKHTCEDAKQHSYTVDLEQKIQDMKPLDPTEFQRYKVMLDTGQTVQVEPIRFRHMIQLFQKNAGKKELTPDEVKENIIFNLVNLIAEVDGISDKKMITEWAKSLTTPQQNKIAQLLETTGDWGPNNMQQLKCKDCGTMMDVELPLNPISFFTE